MNKSTKPNSKLRNILKEIIIFIDEIDHHHIFLLASGIAFNILLYIIPMFLLAIYILNHVFQVDIIAFKLEQLLMDVLPQSESSHRVIREILDELYIINNNSSYAGWIGLGALFWFSSTLFSSIRTGLNAVFSIPTPKIFLLYRLKDILFTLILTLLLLISTYLLPMTTFVVSALEGAIPGIIGKFITQMAFTIISLISSFLIFYFIFRFAPNKKIDFSQRLLATSICVILLELSRRLFAWYVGSISNYGKFYGAYAMLVSMAIWVYYSGIVILLSAEIGRFWHERKLNK